MDKNSNSNQVKSQIQQIKEIDDKFEEEFGIVSKEKNIEDAITFAIASIPYHVFELFKVFCPKEDCNKFCVCINYTSRLFPTNRFHAHITKNGMDFELKTFCYKPAEVYNPKDLVGCFDVDNPFVGLLDFFYDTINVIKEDKKENFSMNKYLENRGGDLRKMEVLDQTKYQEGVVRYLEKTYKKLRSEVNYARYAAYLWIAGGDLNRVKIFDTNDKYNKEVEEVIIEFVSLIANKAESMANWKRFKGDTPYLQYIIPVVGYDDQSGQAGQKIICNVVIPSLIRIDGDALAAIQVFAGAWLNKIWQFENVVLSRRSIVRSAIAQVMARNLSHNYGSHVLNHLLRATLESFMFDINGPYESICKKEFGKDDRRQKDAMETYRYVAFLIGRLSKQLEYFEQLPEISDEVINQIKGIKDAMAEIDGNLTADDITDETIRQVVYLLNHIKCRVDYISDISFGAPLLQTTRSVYNDIFREIDRVSLLMNHISGLEKDFKYKIKFAKEDGPITESNDLRVAVPNDVVGTHAFYNILENVIRNTAKHGSGKSADDDDGVTFHVDFTNPTWDGTEEATDRVEFEEEASKYYCVEIYDNILMDEDPINNLELVQKLVSDQNDRLKKPIFEGERPRSHSLGLIEMAASAAYLRKLDSSAIDDKRYRVGPLDLLKAVVVKGCYFGYRFFMLRPQEVLIVGDNLKNLHNNPQEGIRTITREQLERALGDGLVFNHDFVVYDGADSAIGNLIRLNKTSFSPRVLKMRVEDNITPDELKSKCWKQWNDDNNSKWKWRFFGAGKAEKKDNPYTAVYKHHLKNQTDKDDLEKCSYAEALSSAAINKLPRYITMTTNVDRDMEGVEYCGKLSRVPTDDLDSVSPEERRDYVDAYIRNREAVSR